MKQPVVVRRQFIALIQIIAAQPLIPPLLLGNKLVTDMKTKTNVFNDVSQSDSQYFLTHSRLFFLGFNESKIVKVLRALNAHKAHDLKTKFLLE